MSAAVITFIGVFYGCLSGAASGVVDGAMMRAVELLQASRFSCPCCSILSLMGKPERAHHCARHRRHRLVPPVPHRHGAKSGRSATASISSPRAAWGRLPFHHAQAPHPELRVGDHVRGHLQHQHQHGDGSDPELPRPRPARRRCCRGAACSRWPTAPFSSTRGGSSSSPAFSLWLRC